MNYSCFVSFKKIKACDIPEFFKEMKKGIAENWSSLASENYFYSPISHMKPSDIVPIDENDVNKYMTDFKETQETWVKSTLTYRWFYLKESETLGVFSVPLILSPLFDTAINFQNITDQSYDFETWQPVDAFTPIVSKWRYATPKYIGTQLDWYSTEELQDLALLDYMRKVCCYREIWTSYIEDKLYDDSNAIYISLVSPSCEDFDLVDKIATSAYKKVIKNIKERWRIQEEREKYWVGD